MKRSATDTDGEELIAHKFRSLWCVAEVARHGSINRAAQDVPLSQPAISRTIRLIEASLGVSLFSRNHRGVTPTAFGMLLLRRIERAMTYLVAGERALGLWKKPALATKCRSPLYRFISYRHLQALIAVARWQNTVLAGERLGVTQPAVCRSVNELERIVGIRLFERHYHRMIPTDGGETLRRFFNLALTELRHSANELLARPGEISGRVKIGILPLLQTTLVPQTIAAVAARHKHLHFSMIDGSYEALLSELRRGDVDLIVGALREPPPVADVVEEPLFTDELSVVARADHPLGRMKKLSLQALAATPWIVPSRGTLIRKYFDDMFRQRRLEVPHDLVETSSLGAIRTLLLESNRLTIISPERVRHEEKAGHLIILPMRLPTTRRTIGVTTRSDAVHPPGVALFLEHLRKCAVPTRSKFARSNADRPQESR